MAEWQGIAEAIAKLVHAGGDVADIGVLMKAGADAPISYAAVTELVGEPVLEHKGWQIVVLQRGWVVVGDVTREGDELMIHEASVIRKWGTTKGLGELIDGPLADTVLDAAGTVRANVLGVVLAIDVTASKWAR
jgi:hypothetical protein